MTPVVSVCTHCKHLRIDKKLAPTPFCLPPGKRGITWVPAELIKSVCLCPNFEKKDKELILAETLAEKWEHVE